MPVGDISERNGSDVVPSRVSRDMDTPAPLTFIPLCPDEGGVFDSGEESQLLRGSVLVWKSSQKKVTL